MYGLNLIHPLIADLLTAGSVLTDGAWRSTIQVRGLPIGACPDGWNLEHPDRVVYRITPEEFTGEAMALVANGASFIGGSCGTQPSFIRALAAALARRNG